MFYKNYMERRMDCDRQLQKTTKKDRHKTMWFSNCEARGMSNSEGISKNMEASIIKNN